MKLITIENDTKGILKKKLEPVEEPKSMILILHEMVEIMREHEGVGLTANQIGLDARMFVIQGPHDEHPLFFINPKINQLSKSRVTFEESCLSYPGDPIPIKRPEYVVASWHDGRQQHNRVILTGMTARIFLHEYDHLNGRCKCSGE